MLKRKMQGTIFVDIQDVDMDYNRDENNQI
jgi:hypothetical protein